MENSKKYFIYLVKITNRIMIKMRTKTSISMIINSLVRFLNQHILYAPFCCLTIPKIRNDHWKIKIRVIIFSKNDHQKQLTNELNYVSLHKKTVLSRPSTLFCCWTKFMFLSWSSLSGWLLLARSGSFIFPLLLCG